MKKVFIFSAVIATSLVATKSYSQVYVSAHVGFRVPGARVVVATAPAPVTYPSAPVYNDGYAPAPAYQDGYAPNTLIYENEFPGYVYYNYPAWNGHFRDRVYYSHYRPFFERDHRAYFNRGRFDRARYDHDYRGHRGRW